MARLYRSDSKRVEKYGIEAGHPTVSGGGAGGEYPLQDGFGWRNGVIRRLLPDCPRH